MGRPRTPLGTCGAIRCYQTTSGWRAETLFRDADGRTRAVKRVGASGAAATRRLKEHLAERDRRTGGQLSGDTSFSSAAALWLAEVERTRPGSTSGVYRARLAQVLPALGELRLGEFTPGRVDAYLRALERRLAPNTVRSYRTVVSGVLGYAVRMDALAANPVVGAGRVVGGNVRATKRALTRDEREDLLSKLDADDQAVADDLPDLLRYMLGTGVRIGECLGLRWLRVDLDQGISVHGDNLVRVNGAGLLLKEPKTPAGCRTLPLPEFVVMLLRLRYPGQRFDGSPVFPNVFGGWRDPSNTGAAIRGFRERAGYPWFTSHVCRRTVATALDQARLTPREISGFIGHANPAFTQNRYMDQTPQSSHAGEALDAAMRTANGGDQR